MTNQFHTALLVSAASLGLLAASSSAQPFALNQGTPPPTKTVAEILSFLPEVLATVDGSEVTREMMVKVLEANVPPQQIPGLASRPQTEISQMAAQFANDEVSNIILTKLAGNAGYEPSGETVGKEFDNWFNGLKPEESQQFEAHLSSQQLDVAAYREQMTKDETQQKRIAVTSWMDEKVLMDIEVKDEDVAAEYNQNKESTFSSPTRIKVAHIPFRHDGSEASRTEAQDKANAVLKKIRDGASFEDMVRENPSSDGHLSRLGILELFTRGTYNPEFEDSAFALELDEVSEVIDTPDGFQLIILKERVEGEVVPLEQVQEQIRQNLIGIKQQAAITAVLDEGRKSYNTEILVGK